MKTRKTILRIGTLAITMTLFMLLSCQKERRNPASLIEGEYQGNGTLANESPYIGLKIRIVELSKKKVRIESIGNSTIPSFEIEVMYFKDAVSSADGATGSLGAPIEDGSAINIGFTSPTGETFAGFKL